MVAIGRFARDPHRHPGHDGGRQIQARMGGLGQDTQTSRGQPHQDLE
jgi:hypothetical protein